MTTVEHASWLRGTRSRSTRVPREASMRSVSVSLSTVGLLTVAISAWGGIVPYVGPTFGFSADGSSSWHWSLTHSVLALVPGAIGVLVGLSFMMRVPGARIGRRKASLSMAGLVAVVCGAWFVIGPIAWPLVDNVRPFFVLASPLRVLSNEVGYSFGPGIILAACGAFAIGWATRHNQPLQRSVNAHSNNAQQELAPANDPDLA